ncbi:Arc family DNA-binding protein [Acinetobacter brisouii]
MYPFWGYWSSPKMGLSLFLFYKPFAMSEEDNKVVTLKVRVTPEFREKIVNTAKENNRSMNAEIVARLEKSFEANPSNVDLSNLIARQEETLQYMKELHEQNRILSEKLNEVQKENSHNFKNIQVLRGLDAVSRDEGRFLSDNKEIPFSSIGEQEDSNKNWQNLNPNNRNKKAP